MDISFDYYKVFYEVARCQNITQAALNLCLTQPTVTKYIHNLEDMLQCKVNLQLWVKVKKDWRDSDFLLKNFGYNPKDPE